MALNSNEARADVQNGVGVGLALISGGSGFAGYAGLSTTTGFLGLAMDGTNFFSNPDISSGYETVKYFGGFIPSPIGPAISVTDGVVDAIKYDAMYNNYEFK